MRSQNQGPGDHASQPRGAHSMQVLTLQIDSAPDPGRVRLLGPVDPGLFETAHQLMQIWKCWYPNLSLIHIGADVEPIPPRNVAGKTAAFFSGGVDSFFTAL